MISAKALAFVTVLASVALAQIPPQHKVHGFVPEKRYGKHQLVNQELPHGIATKHEQVKAVSNVDGFFQKKNSDLKFFAGKNESREYQIRADDSCYPPLQEQWRCLGQGRGEFTVEEYYNIVPKHLFDNADCPMIDENSCTKPESDYYPVPCNCHAYFRCFEQGSEGKMLPCIYWCNPCSLVFDPNSKNCVYEPEAPPGTCFDTPPPPSSTTPDTTTPTTHTTTTTTTTTTPTTTPTTTSTTTTTTPNPFPCTYEGETLPHPGNCHWYYRCRAVGSSFEVDLFDCGDWVFDPHQGSCTQPEHGDELCPP